MVFSSAIFLFGFLPAFLAIYYMVPFRHRSLVILLGSYAFYGWWRIDFLALFVIVTLWNYGISRVIADSDDPRRRKQALTLGVVGDLAVLGYFKYFNFGIDSLNTLIGTPDTVTAWSVILPIGISFYIFQAISYLVDVYRGDAPVTRRFVDFAAFIALFPQLIAGPVLRYKDLADQFAEREHSFRLFSLGARRFVLGLSMKVLIADSLAPLVDLSFGLQNPTAAEAWLGAVAYTLQLFFDFAGYSAMAIGIGLMMGFRFIENFNSPYASQSITEFWRRWHISLSTWLRDYLYIPLGGNRKGRVRTYVNLMATMVLGGLWHGANWTFVLWGAWHGAILSIERAFGVNADLNAPRRFGPLLLTFILVMIGWVMFRAADVGTAFAFYKAMAGLNGFALSDQTAWQIGRDDVFYLIAGSITVVAMYVLGRPRGRLATIQAPSRTGASAVMANVALAGCMLLSASRIMADSYSPFLYFQF